MYDYNCPDCNEAKLQSDKNARKINEIISQVNQIVENDIATTDYLLKKADEIVGQTAEIKVNKEMKEINTEIDNNKKSIEIERERINNLIVESGSGSENVAEIVDARTGNNGLTHSLVGEHIRSVENSNDDLIKNVFNFEHDFIINIFNKNDLTKDKMINGNGAEAVQNGCSCTNYFTQVKKGEKLTLNFATHFTIARYNLNKQFISIVTIDSENLPYTYTSAEDGYLRFNIYTGHVDNAMIVKGDTLPPKYIEYGGKSILESETTFKEFKRVLDIFNQYYKTNLLNKDNMTDGKLINASGIEATQSGCSFTNDYTLLRKGESVTLNFATHMTIAKYDINKKFLNIIVVDNEHLPFTYIASDDCYLRFNVYTGLKNTAMVINGKTIPNKYIEYGEYYNEAVNIDKFTNTLKGNYLFAGDSICYGAGATEKGGYAKLIANKNKDMTYKNIGVSGAILCRRTVGDSGSTVLEQIENEIALNNVYNHIVVEGGINDIWNMNKYPLGVYDRYNINSVLNENTICGAFESIIRKSKNAWNDAIIYYIIPHLMSAELATPVFDTLKNICEKYNVIVIDLRKISGMDVTIQSVKEKYTGNSDGVHPNDDGYRKFYIKPIIDILSKYQ